MRGKMIELTVDIYFNTVEGLERGECEVVSMTQKNPYGTWRYCISKAVVIDLEKE